jgi:OmpA-OmpF porin, OOP family
MRKLCLSLFSLSLCLGVFAQPAKDSQIKAGTLAIHFGMQDFITPQRIKSTSLPTTVGNQKWAKFADQAPALGISYIKGISNHFDFSVNYFLASVAYPFRDGSPQPSTSYLLHEADGSIAMKLLPDNHFFVPYLSAGVGASAYQGGRFDAFMPLGGGIQLRLAEGTFLFSNFQYRIPVTERANYHFLSTFGVGTQVGKKKEELKPLPPPPPPPAPKDTDNDGIVDNEDKCPTVPGIPKYQGCPVPDTDKDGINDEQDRCPTVAGVAKYQGCPVPDTDGDGLNDEQDKCPTVAGVAKYQGCPIPDRDNDGVNDEVDKCPDVPGSINNEGCPEIKFTPENITFKTGSAVLTATGIKELTDNVLPPLKQYEKANVEIQGHTDNTGNAASNLKLSQKRADAVKAWLVKNGIAAERMTTKGFGQTEPVGDNKTTSGRAKNRRVHIELIK